MHTEAASFTRAAAAAVSSLPNDRRDWIHGNRQTQMLPARTTSGGSTVRAVTREATGRCGRGGGGPAVPPPAASASPPSAPLGLTDFRTDGQARRFRLVPRRSSRHQGNISGLVRGTDQAARRVRAVQSHKTTTRALTPSRRFIWNGADATRRPAWSCCDRASVGGSRRARGPRCFISTAPKKWASRMRYYVAHPCSLGAKSGGDQLAT